MFDLNNTELFKFVYHPGFGCPYSGWFAFVEFGNLAYRFKVFDGHEEKIYSGLVEIPIVLENQIWKLLESNDSKVKDHYDAGWDDMGGSTFVLPNKLVRIDGPYDPELLETDEEVLLFELNKALNKLVLTTFGK